MTKPRDPTWEIENANTLIYGAMCALQCVAADSGAVSDDDRAEATQYLVNRLREHTSAQLDAIGAMMAIADADISQPAMHSRAPGDRLQLAD